MSVGNGKITTLLAADIGGTKSDLAMYDLECGDSRSLFTKRYENIHYSGIEEIITAFLAESSYSPSIGCFAVAGIINGVEAYLTNLPWLVNCDTLAQQFGLDTTYLINDLTAISSALSLLGSEDVMEVQKGVQRGGRVKGIVAPGTGLGQGFVVDSDGQFFVSGCEGGHTDFGPVNEEQIALLQWMQKKESPVSYEMVIAGPGLMNLYDFYKEALSFDESDWVKEEMAKVADRTPVIIAAAIQDTPCPLCVKVVDLFMTILGSEAANLALKLYATGGIYLGGGILPRLKDVFDFSLFLQSFQNKGPMTELLKSIPIYLILRNDAALLGIRNYACQMLGVRAGNANSQ